MLFKTLRNNQNKMIDYIDNKLGIKTEIHSLRNL